MFAVARIEAGRFCPLCAASWGRAASERCVQALMLHGLLPNSPTASSGHEFEIVLQGHHWLAQTDFNLGWRYRQCVERRVAS
jgi:hypothetical protein